MTSLKLMFFKKSKNNKNKLPKLNLIRTIKLNKKINKMLERGQL